MLMIVTSVGLVSWHCAQPAKQRERWTYRSPSSGSQGFSGLLSLSLSLAGQLAMTDSCPPALEQHLQGRWCSLLQLQ